MPDSSNVLPAESLPRRFVGRGERITLITERGRMERVRDAVFWTPGETISSVVDRALEAEVARMERERGAPFPTRTASLRAGRPARDAVEAAD